MTDEQKNAIEKTVMIYVKALINHRLDRQAVEKYLKMKNVWVDELSPVIMNGAVDMICDHSKEILNLN